MKSIDFSKLKTSTTNSRKVCSDVFNPLPERYTSFLNWFNSLPPFLGANNLTKAVKWISESRENGKAVAVALGGHVLKVGCGPIIVDLINRGFITSISMNGAAAIHDVELSILGDTSENVDEGIKNGSFGMNEHTVNFFSKVCEYCPLLGLALGDALLRNDSDDQSILASAVRKGIPVTVHVAIGTDTIHMHPHRINLSALCTGSINDFKKLCDVMSKFNDGVWCNIGSAVLLPEVFLKALTVVRNLGYDLKNLRTINFDMQNQYRTSQNIINRPVNKGNGIQIIGHHEILLPLLRQAIIEKNGRYC